MKLWTTFHDAKSSKLYLIVSTVIHVVQIQQATGFVGGAAGA